MTLARAGARAPSKGHLQLIPASHDDLAVALPLRRNTTLSACQILWSRPGRSCEIIYMLISIKSSQLLASLRAVCLKRHA